MTSTTDPQVESGTRTAQDVVSIALADDIPLMVDGVAGAIGGDDGFAVAGVSHSIDDLLDGVGANPPDVLVMDPWMQGGAGLDAIRAIHERHPGVVVIALSSVTDPDHVRAAINAGARAYVGKDTAGRDLRVLIRHVLAGAQVMPAVAARGADVTRLTSREREVLRLAAEGMSNREIAQVLFVTDQTVKFHLGNVYRKLGVTNRTEAARQAMRRGLVA